jgi:hypothetical protein
MHSAGRAATIKRITEIRKGAAMSTHSMPWTLLASTRQRSTSWMSARASWAGLAIISMWLAVLFVGVFGGNIQQAGASGTSSVPVVVVVAIVALIGTYAVGRRAFTASSADEETRRALELERQALVARAAEVSELRAKLSG